MEGIKKIIRMYEERWQRLSCFLLERNEKGHENRLPVHKLVTKKVVVCRTKINEFHWWQSRFGSDREDKILAMKSVEQTH